MATMSGFIRSVPALRSLARTLIWPVRQVAQMRHRQSSDVFEAACRRLAVQVERPTFVKVGANDGLTGDPCSAILLEGDAWSGMLIEPVPYCFERLKVNFGDVSRFRLEQVAVGPATSQAIFYYVDPKARTAVKNLPDWFDQLGSFDRQHITKHLDGVLEPFILEHQVEVRPLSDIIAAAGVGQVHLLHVDTEGYDFEVLKTLDFSRHAPVLILIEHKHLRPADKRAMRRMLKDGGYKVSNCGADYMAMHEVQAARLGLHQE